ncbi:MAG: hypothetical protein Q8Q59_00770 [Luteolibacter sp.]|jgi:signal transduction histidine kinase|nr:hypothetical protein [Luteolibacter sp.]
MNYRHRIAAWSGISLTALIGLLIFTAHSHLDEELRKDRWDRSHPKYPDWVIHGSFTDVEVHDILGELMKIWLWVGIPAVGVSLGIGHLLARRSVRPVRHINRQLAALTPDRMRKGIVSPENDPVLADLVTHINSSLDRAGAAYEEMAEFSSKVAHELRTPLTLLRMKIEQSSGGFPPDIQEELQDELARLSRSIERSLLAAKAESGSLEPNRSRLDFSRLLEDIGDGYTLLAAERGLDLAWDVSPDLEAFTDPDLLRQVLHNLLGNALRYAHKKVEVKASQANGDLELVISNDRDPKSMATSGLGLGLRLVTGVCRATGIHFESHSTSSEFSAIIRIPDNPKP